VLDQEIVDIQDLDGDGPVTAGKLSEAGYDSILAIAIAPIRESVDKASLDASVAYKIVKAARRQIDTGFITAKQLYDKRQNLQRLTLDSQNLNKLLGSRVETQAITEFVGEFGSGKSQLCMKLSVTVQLPQKDGDLEGKVLFIEGTFSAERVYQIGQAMQLQPEKILEGILCARVYNQVLAVDQAFKLCQEENVNSSWSTRSCHISEANT
jgi:DNA repair protein RadA